MADRYYCAELPVGGGVRLDGDVGVHLARVMRVRAGARLVLFDGMGAEADAVVTRVDRATVEVEVTNRRVRGPDPGRHVELAFSPPRSTRASAVLEHGTELGARAFHPIVTSRTPPPAKSPKSRWQRIVVAAAGQCGASFLPRLHEPMGLAEFVTTVVDGFEGERWVATPSTPNPAAEAPPATAALVLVGPEGGFTDAELELLLGHGCARLDLGPNTLRTETAALAALTLLRLSPPRWPG